ncbi:hypothetical protein AaE_015796 [Aphanomyces astaci]|uniref:Reverse transcriptase Ty1/copia-type domain-containing protein n=1 Tax=Aphanomyces astaci TaxID=112090 RepID=A0A6A4Z5X3_APHAT|nr:hypothetical protein AaE_015796 [Aphanomyces astaci]
MDVHTAFLNGDMPADLILYMRQAPGYVLSENPHKVYQLVKSIYGLKQAPRIWYNLLHKFLTSIGFERCNKEYCLYVQKVGDSNDDWLIVVVYVDDLTIVSRNAQLVKNLQVELNKRFKMQDLGDLHYILKMEVKRNRVDKTMSLSQTKYIHDLLAKFGVQDSTAVSTPQVVGVDLVAEAIMTQDEIAKQPYDYRGLVGSLQYLVRGTRPDIANAVRELSKFLSCYNKTHWDAALRILKYLKGTSSYGLFIDGKMANVSYEVYTDASFASQNNERKSITGYLIMIAGICISWCSSKQACVAKSTAESEIIALSEGVKESEWLSIYRDGIPSDKANGRMV